MKRHYLPVLCLVLFGFCCKNVSKPIVNLQFTDSLIKTYQISPWEKLIAADQAFWQKRVAQNPESQTALVHYAGDLVQEFHLHGQIAALLMADSILEKINAHLPIKESGILRSLASISISRHQFKKADTLVAAGGELYASTLLYFDTQFELGNYVAAKLALNNCTSTNQYGYFFRLSKWKHLKGETDSAIFYMQKAVDVSGNSLVLKQVALSNMADLYMHEGALEQARDIYMQNLKVNAADYHSLQGLGRIALLKDRQPIAAEKIFRFIGAKYALPDATYLLVWVAEQMGDSIRELTYAKSFVKKATAPEYGDMYHKYLIELMTGILHDEAGALKIAENEINNRATPQTYAWYVWCLHKSHQDEKAFQLYKEKVAGKPLEALELFWMGEMMKDNGKQFNAKAFYEAAAKNKYDLSPAKLQALEKMN
jgi:Tfp pilus assembly protein PilF